MDSLIKTLDRIIKMCQRHEGECGACVFKEKRHVQNQPEHYVCVIMEAFEECFAPNNGILQPTQWDTEPLKEKLGERSI